MGGTTAKASLVEGGIPKVASHFEVGRHAAVESRGAGYPVRIPVLDLVEIGAGGGSIARVDPGGGLRVGPESAGADPGPACYGRGGDLATVTDANLLLGLLNPGYFLGGEFKLYPDLAEKAIARLAKKLDLAPIAAAEGIIEIANANMAGALRLVSVQRGFDPREFALVAFGGAGPLHANALARDLSIPKVLIPMGPGVTTALGLLVSDIRHDYTKAYLRKMSSLDFSDINQIYLEMEEQGRAVLHSEAIEDANIHFSRHMDIRYVGQSYELKVVVPGCDLRRGDEAALNAAFYKEHEKAYGYAATTEATEVVNLRVTAIGSITRPHMRQLPRGDRDSSQAIKGQREVYFPEARKQLLCTVYERYQLKSGNWIDGPAIVEEIDSTTAIHPGYCAIVDVHGNLLIQSNGDGEIHGNEVTIRRTPGPQR
jgi:N-methylhydantoinase A